MNLYCIEEFKIEFEKLKKKRQYKDLEEEIIDYFIDKETEDLMSGSNISNDPIIPFIKKRLSGRYRIYYLLVIKDGNVFLMYVYPKTGPYRIVDTSTAFKKELLKKVISCIKSKNYFAVNVTEENSLFFTKICS
jgi:hypothetical protein